MPTAPASARRVTPARRRVRRTLRWALIGFGLSPLAACSRADLGAAPPLAVLRIGMPQKNVASYVAGFLSDEGLIAHGLQNAPAPRIAERWERLEGGRVLRFHIRPGVTFVDGTPVTADRVRESLAATAISQPALTQYPLLRSIVAITAGETTVDVRMEPPSALALDDLLAPIRRSRRDGVPVGAGPFRVVSRTEDLITMEANRSYYRGQPLMDRIDIRSYTTVRAAWTALMRDEIDLLYEVPWDALDFLEHEPSVRVYSFLRPYIYMLVFNTERPVLADPRIRTALRAAIDREHLVKAVLDGHGRAATGPVWPGYAQYQADIPWVRYDPAGAERTIAQRVRSPLRFTCLLAPERAPYEHLALLLQQALRRIGVEMELEPLPMAEFTKRYTAGDYDAALNELPSGPGLARLYTLWHSSSDLLKPRYHGADRALDALRAATDDERLRRAALDVQRAMYDDPPGLFLFWTQASRALSRRFDPSPYEPDRDILGNLWQWRPAAASAP